MRKRSWFLGLFLVVVLSAGPAVGGVDYRAAGTGDYGISFNSGVGVRQFSIMAYSADIEVTLYLDSVALDTVSVLARLEWAPVILCDSIYVDRTSSTAVLTDWNEFLKRDVAIARKSYAHPDPTGPPPVTVTDQIMIVEDFEVSGAAIYPTGAGIDFNGARGAYWTLEYASFSAGSLAVALYIGPTGTHDPDSMYAVYNSDGTPVKWLYDSDSLPTAGGIFEPITVFEGGIMAGYGYLKIYDPGTTLSIADIDAAMVTIW